MWGSLPSSVSFPPPLSPQAAAQHKAFKRKISVVSAAKGAAAGNSDTEGGQSGGRKRRWGSSTAATQKKPSISITTESLKSLIPEMKPVAGQEAVVDLHADDSRISEDEGERHGEPPAHEKGLKICRTVTQVVPAEGQENGQGEEEEEEEKEPEEEQPEAPQVTAELPLPPPVEHEVKKVTLSDTLTRRSISQQRSGVSITIDDPVRTAQLPSPPRAKPSPIVHICNLVRPFTLGQLKELLGRTGTLVEEAFWIDKIKSHCYVTYSTVEEAVLTRNALHGVKWPQSNPKFLSADFAEQDELDFHRGLLPERAVEAAAAPGAGPAGGRGGRRSAPRERSREPERAAREQWAEREREMERRERTRAEREWDRDKVREGPRSRSRERRRKEPPKAKEKKGEKKGTGAGPGLGCGGGGWGPVGLAGVGPGLGMWRAGWGGAWAGLGCGGGGGGWGCGGLAGVGPGLGCGGGGWGCGGLVGGMTLTNPTLNS
uniref:Apoptotic chromatin condensation inducer 1 n=1 Tax=Terrapene triunguis TaxID=2587831 RepID=A0A674JWD6_9SAUR